MLEKAVEVTRRGRSTNVQYARFADDLVGLIDADRRNDWLCNEVDGDYARSTRSSALRSTKTKVGYRI